MTAIAVLAFTHASVFRTFFFLHTKSCDYSFLVELWIGRELKAWFWDAHVLFVAKRRGSVNLFSGPQSTVHGNEPSIYHLWLGRS
jgi:hypothetical protein